MLVWKLSLPSQAAVHPHRIFFARFLARRTASRRDRPNNRELKDEQTGIIPNWNPPADTARGQKWGAAWELRPFVTPKPAPHMGCVQSSSIISALCMFLVWIRSVSPSLPCSWDDRITSHPVELVGSDQNPSMLEGIGLGLAGPSFFTACFSPGGLIRRSRPPGSGEAVAFSFAGMGSSY